MDNKDKKDKKLEIARNILYNAVSMNIRMELLLEISRKIDKYVVEYYRNGRIEKDGR